MHSLPCLLSIIVLTTACSASHGGDAGGPIPTPPGARPPIGPGGVISPTTTARDYCLPSAPSTEPAPLAYFVGADAGDACRVQRVEGWSGATRPAAPHENEFRWIAAGPGSVIVEEHLRFPGTDRMIARYHMADGRVWRVEQHNTTGVEITENVFDAEGRRTATRQLRLEAGVEMLAAEQRYRYDGDRLVESSHAVHAAPRWDAVEHTTTYEYDADGRLILAVADDQADRFDRTAAWEYDAEGRLARLRYSVNGTLHIEATFGYDAGGRLASRDMAITGGGLGWSPYERGPQPLFVGEFSMVVGPGVGGWQMPPASTDDGCQPLPLAPGYGYGEPIYQRGHGVEVPQELLGMAHPALPRPEQPLIVAPASMTPTPTSLSTQIATRYQNDRMVSEVRTESRVDGSIWRVERRERDLEAADGVFETFTREDDGVMVADRRLGVEWDAATGRLTSRMLFEQTGLVHSERWVLERSRVVEHHVEATAPTGIGTAETDGSTTITYDAAGRPATFDTAITYNGSSGTANRQTGSVELQYRDGAGESGGMHVVARASTTVSGAIHGGPTRWRRTYELDAEGQLVELQMDDGDDGSIETISTVERNATGEVVRSVIGSPTYNRTEITDYVCD